MQFESKLKRRYWLNTFLNLIPDALIAVLLAAVFGTGVIGFLITIIGIQLLYLLIWIKDSAWSWLMFAAFGRKQSAEMLRDNLAARKFPEPTDYQRSIDGYFGDVASDESQPIGTRVAAAAEFGALSYPASQGRFQEALRVSMAYEDALVAYKKSFPAYDR